jgi:CubicO group peptidase (beta-lactamase class C family)
MAFQAYHGVTGAQHQTNFNNLSAHGYRMISLSVYGDPGSAQYAAVWVQRPGPAWVAVHGVDSAGYQSFFNNWSAKGFVPVLISATGAVNNAVFAAVFEQGIAGAWFARHGMTSGAEANANTFQHFIKSARDQKMILRSIAIYGTASDRRYAGVWLANPGFVKWHAHPSDTGASYQTVFNAETQLPGYDLHAYRPAYVALSDDHMYCSTFKDDVVGPWVARHGLTSAQYQSEFDSQNAAGFYPICVQGGGSGANARYAAIFAKQDIPASRAWTVTGTSVPTLAALDHAMQSFMQANGVRAAQLAVAKNGVTKFSRAYTWAEPGYRITQPSDRFLLASCSKMFLEAAVQSLYDAKKILPGTKVYPLLGFSNPADPGSNDITIQQLLDHMGGYDDTPTGSGFDPTYNMRLIAQSLGLNHPVTKLDIARYMYGKPLDFTPGTNNKYSNFGYLLAGAVVEKVTGTTFFSYVKTTLLQTANITEVEVFPTLAANRTSHQAIVEDEGLGKSPLDLASNLLVPGVYGGDGEINEVGDPNDGLGASAHALTQFIHLHAVWGNGPRAAGAARSGSTPGASTLAVSRGDGIDWACVVNTRDWPPSTSPTLDDLFDTTSPISPHSITHVLDTTAIP